MNNSRTTTTIVNTPSKWFSSCFLFEGKQNTRTCQVNESLCLSTAARKNNSISRTDLLFDCPPETVLFRCPLFGHQNWGKQQESRKNERKEHRQDDDERQTDDRNTQKRVSLFERAKPRDSALELFNNNCGKSNFRTRVAISPILT